MSWFYNENTIFHRFGVDIPLGDFAYPYIAYRNGKSVGGYNKIEDIPKKCLFFENKDCTNDLNSLGMILTSEQTAMDDASIIVKLRNIKYFEPMSKYLPTEYEFGVLVVPNEFSDLEKMAYDRLKECLGEYCDGAEICVMDNRDVRVNGRLLDGTICNIHEGQISYYPAFKHSFKKVKANSKVFVDGIETDGQIASLQSLRTYGLGK